MAKKNPRSVREILKDIVEAILNETKDYDLIVLGRTRDPLIYQFVRESIPDIAARKCNKPLIMVKASGGIRSWIKRWF
jgi:nucleotide-binding universal stress UspA family protein